MEDAQLDLLVVESLASIAPDRSQPHWYPHRLERDDEPDRRLGNAASQLKALAKHHHLSVLIGIEIDTANSPLKISDLRSLACIESDADVILLIQDQTSEPSVTVVRVAKNRHGSIGRAQLWTHPGCGIVRDKEQRNYV